MALWRDPLEELIGELERTLPAPAGASTFDGMPSLEDYQYAIHATLYGKGEADPDPRVRAAFAALARYGASRRRARMSGDADKTGRDR